MGVRVLLTGNHGAALITSVRNAYKIMMKAIRERWIQKGLVAVKRLFVTTLLKTRAGGIVTRGPVRKKAYRKNVETGKAQRLRQVDVVLTHAVAHPV
jgi:hypothetical protein